MKRFYKWGVMAMALLASKSQAAEEISALEVLLGAYNGALQVYTQEQAGANTLPQLSREQLQQLQTLITDHQGQIDLARVQALLALTAQQDGSVAEVAAKLQTPVAWAQSLQEIAKPLWPVSQKEGLAGVNDTLNALASVAKTLEQTIAEHPVLQHSLQEPSYHQNLKQEVNHLKALAEKQMPTYWHQTEN